MIDRLGYGRWIAIMFGGIITVINPHAIAKLKLEYPDNLFYGGTIITISILVLMFKYIIYRSDKGTKK